jgi:hypothetical protein
LSSQYFWSVVPVRKRRRCHMLACGMIPCWSLGAVCDCIVHREA